ncbi:MAG: hypothetical protein HYX27_14050 [Acidobacteria bacterium]|nr:hypothetical protein [Acidobacteriota bacterium]
MTVGSTPGRSGGLLAARLATPAAGVDTTARLNPQGEQVNARFGQAISTRTPRVIQLSLRVSF